jgi:acetylornithine deacetylase/succinyl-diaminopimelate desuccinylase-like protein
VRGEHIFARGVTDMKGQVLAGIHAIESIVRTAAPAQYPAPSAPMPVNVKFLIEGEEEIGSPSLSDFMRTNRELLSCDMALNLDTGILSASQPSITYALRGLAYFELRVYGPAHDLHSGIYGGVVHNPAQALCELIAGMHDAQGHVTLPGFYEKVRVVGDEEKAELAYLSADTAPSPMNELYFLEETGVPALWGEAEYTPLERVSARPTLEVHGLFSGFTGEGSKTALPAWAMAKISCRLVPDQDPQEVYKQFLNYLKKHAPPTIRWEVTKMAGGPAVISERNSIGVKAMQKALASVWGTPPLFKREGGSVPVVTQFRNILGVESVNSGFAMTGDNAHGPNEKLHLPTWYRGIDAVIHFFFNLSNQSNNEAS